MRVQRHLSISVPIPSSLPASHVIAVLQTVSPVIRNLGTLSRYEETSPANGTVSDPIVAADPFFIGGSSPPDTTSPQTSSSPPEATTTTAPVASYQIFELITLAPGLTKEVTYPAYFQRVSDGIRCRANGAAGITGWCEFTVRPRTTVPAAGVNTPDSPEGSTSTPSTYGGGDPGIGPSPLMEYELYEAIVVEANSLLMPFVCQTMQVAHRGLCDKVLKEAAEQYIPPQPWDYQ